MDPVNITTQSDIEKNYLLTDIDGSFLVNK